MKTNYIKLLKYFTAMAVVALLGVVHISSVFAAASVSTLSELQSAIDKSSPGEVITITKPISVDKTIIIKGDDKDITLTGKTLKRASGFRDAMILIEEMPKGDNGYGYYATTETNAKLRLKNIEFDGNVDVDKSDVIVWAGNGSTVYIQKGVVLKNNQGNGIDTGTRSSANFIMSGGEIKNNKGDGVFYSRAEAGVADVKIDGGSISNNGGRGICINSSADISNCKIEGNGDAGIYCDADSGSVVRLKDNTINGNNTGINWGKGKIEIYSGSISKNKKNGIYCASREGHIKIFGGDISGNKECGISTYGLLELSGKGKIAKNNSVELCDYVYRGDIPEIFIASGPNKERKELKNLTQNGKVVIASKLSYTGAAMRIVVKTRGTIEQRNLVYIENKKYAKPSQFIFTDKRKKLVMGSNKWMSLEYK